MHKGPSHWYDTPLHGAPNIASGLDLSGLPKDAFQKRGDAEAERKARNAYMKKYMKLRYAAKRAAARENAGVAA